MRRPASNAGPTAPDGVAEFHRPGALGELLPRGDFVILTVPHTPTTVGFFDRKPAAFFINIGRGMTTKLDDLVTALEAGEIAGAVDGNRQAVRKDCYGLVPESRW